MRNALTPGALDEIEALERAATPGPWTDCNYDDSSSMNIYMVNQGTGEPDGPFHEGEMTLEESSVVCVTLLQTAGRVGARHGRWEENARLIAALRNAAPALIAEVRRARRVEALARQWFLMDDRVAGDGDPEIIGEALEDIEEALRDLLDSKGDA